MTKLPPLGQPAEDATGQPSSEEVRAAIERLAQSDAFRSSSQLVAFLRYVTEAVLAGNTLHVKAYTIAVEAFGRNEAFDPQTDPIVRVEAARLRRTLERYYLEQGASDPILIDLPRGKYIPTFSYREPSPLRRGIRHILRRPILTIRWEPNGYAVLGAAAIVLAALGAWDLFLARGSCAAF